MKEKMKLSDEGVKFIKEKEGVRYQVYKDAAGYPTAGVGHLLNEAERLKWHSLGTSIPEKVVDDWLRRDVEAAEKCVNQWVTTEISQKAFDALVSFVFNVGCGAFKKSQLLRSLNKGAIQETSAEFMRWVNAGGKKLKGLVARRRAEQQLYLDGEMTKISSSQTVPSPRPDQ